MKAILCAILLMASFSVASENEYAINFASIPEEIDIENPTTSTGVPITGPWFSIGDTKYAGDDILKTLIRTGEERNGEIFGQVYDHTGDAYPGWIHWALDFTGFLEAHGKFWMLSHWESRIGMLTLGELEQDPENGELTVKSIKNLDFKELVHPSFHYISEPCSGSVTPWSTFLSSQEYPFDPKWFNKDANPDLTSEHVCDKWWAASEWFPYPHAPEGSTVFAYNNKTCDKTKDLDVLINEFYETYVNIYWNGLIIETEVLNAEGDVKLSPRFALGRLSAEKPLVMPDRKTVYIAEDRKTQCFWKFVADKADDLSCGTLYAAKVTTMAGWDDPANGILDFEWISLGHACDADFSADVVLAAGVNNWFETVPSISDENSKYSCPEGYVGYLINNHVSYNSECIKLRNDLTIKDNTIASRLEAQRYAAWLGATQEFSYLEGLDFDSDLGDRLYIGSAKVYAGMANGESDDKSSWDYLGTNGVQFAENSRGCIFQMILDENYNGKQWTTMRCGEEGGFKNIDNVGYVHGHDMIILCEDASRNGNDPNYVWAMDKHTTEIKPIIMSPNGAEMVNGYTYNLGDFTYIVIVTQHPYENDYADMPRHEECGPLGLEEACGDMTGTGDWLSYYVWPKRVEEAEPTASPTSAPKLEGPSTFTLTIQKVADCNQDKVSLSEIWFYDSDGQAISYDDLTVYEESSPGNERPSTLHDQNVVSKWLDFGMDCSTGKVITGSLPSYPGSYHFSTANDSPERDPVSWTLSVCSTMGICVEDVRVDVGSPEARRAHYPTQLIGATYAPTHDPTTTPTTTPETNPPTASPTNSPTEAPAKAYDIIFKFYHVRDCTAENLIAMAEIYFYDAEMNKISWDTINVENGDSPGRERPKNLYDEDLGSKWLDRAFECSSINPLVVNIQVLEFRPFGYTFVTPNDFPERDPISWDVTTCSDGICHTEIVQDTDAPEGRHTEYGFYSLHPIDSVGPTAMPIDEPCPNCCIDTPTCAWGEATRIDSVLENRPECSCCHFTCPEQPECETCCSAAPECEHGDAILGSTDADENGCTCCDWTCPDPPAPSMDVVCSCISQYEICESDCAAYTNSVPSDDSICMDAFMNLVCVEGVENSFFGTPYYVMCPDTCPLNCNQYDDTEESLACLKKHIMVLEYEVDMLQTNAGVDKQEAMDYCDAVKEEVNEMVTTGSC